eukprot:g28202.t1
MFSAKYIILMSGSCIPLSTLLLFLFIHFSALHHRLCRISMLPFQALFLFFALGSAKVAPEKLQECYHILVEKADYFNVECLKVVVSKLLSYGIVAGACVVKIPQIYKIYAAKDVTGLSLVSFYSEALAYTCMISYSYQKQYPILAYGEAIAVLVQSVALVLMYWVLAAVKPTAGHQVFAVLVYASLLAASLNTPAEYLGLFPMIGASLNTLSRVPQILTNLSNGHTGQMAFLTWFMNFAGSSARVFTFWQETKDLILVASSALASFLNGVIVFQIIWYRKATRQHLAKVAAKKD